MLPRKNVTRALVFLIVTQWRSILMNWIAFLKIECSTEISRFEIDDIFLQNLKFINIHHATGFHIKTLFDYHGT